MTDKKQTARIGPTGPGKLWGLIKDNDILVGRHFTCPHCGGSFSIQKTEVPRKECFAKKPIDQCKKMEDGYCAECHASFY
jgi:hypothetical protein